MSCNFPGTSQSSGWIEKASSRAVKMSSSPDNDVRWTAAEIRITELLSRIEPNQHSERRRKDVADYVKGLIRERLDCQVFNFGSVPLKTYLPDGDIDLTTFSTHQNAKDTWVNDVQSVLKNEEQRQGTKFCVREVQCIPAEVKIVKCVVEDILVDISFNQLGGLCTLCFLEEVDRLIQKDHLFKRSIILVKAWCYYESRLLGAHHGLISTYALETLVLYILNVFHSTLRGPLEVLYMFLDYFSNFDWEKYCISLWGPIPLASISDLRESPFVKEDELLLSKGFLEACRAKYDVLPKGQDPQERIFGEKFLNILDPLQSNNNLGRSVSKANFFRVRGAFSLGARKLAKVFEASDDDFPMYLDDFFRNTWERHRSGTRRDAPDSLFVPFHSFVYKVDDIQDGSIEDSCVPKLKISDVGPHINDNERKDCQLKVVKDICSQNCSLDGMRPVPGLNNYKENTSPSDMNVLLKSQDFLTSCTSSTESPSIAYNPRHASQAMLRRTVSESKLEKLSCRKPFSEDASRNVMKPATKKVDINNHNDATHTVRDGTNSTLSRVNVASCKCESTKQQSDSMQVGDQLFSENKVFQDAVHLTNLADETYETVDLVTRYPDSKAAVCPHSQGPTPYAFTSPHPGTTIFSPSPESASSVYFPELNRSKSNVSSSITVSVPLVSPMTHIQFPHSPVPIPIPYTTGIATISPLYPFEQDKQDMHHVWRYPNASLSASQMQQLRNLRLVGSDAASTGRIRQVSQRHDKHVKVKDGTKGQRVNSFKGRIIKNVPEETLKLKGIENSISMLRNESRESCGEHNESEEDQWLSTPCSSSAGSEASIFMLDPSIRTTADSCVSSMVDFPAYSSSREVLSDGNVGKQSNVGMPITKVPNPIVDTLIESPGYEENFISPVVQLSLPTEGTAPGISMHFPVGTIPIFSYYDPFHSVISNIDNGFVMDAVKDLSHYNGHGCGQFPYSIDSEYASQSNVQNRNCIDAGSTAVEYSGHVMNSSADLLSSDLVTHLQHLKFGRSCQEPILDPPVTNHVKNPFVWKGISCVPIHGTTNVPQGSNFPDSMFTFSHISTELQQQYACNFNDAQQQQIGTGSFLPFGPGLCSDAQFYAGNCPQVAAQYDHNYRNTSGRDIGNCIAQSLLPTSSQLRVAEGKSGARNAWRKSHHPIPSYSPISSALVVSSLNGPYKALSRVQAPVVATGLSPHFPSRTLPAVPQLEFGSFGPMTVITPSGDSEKSQGSFSTNSEAHSCSFVRDIKKPLIHSRCSFLYEMAKLNGESPQLTEMANEQHIPHH